MFLMFLMLFFKFSYVHIFIINFCKLISSNHLVLISIIEITSVSVTASSSASTSPISSISSPTSAASIATSSSASSSSSTRESGFLTDKVQKQFSAIHFRVKSIIKSLNSVVFVSKFHVAETSRFTGFFVGDNSNANTFAEDFQLFHFVFGGSPWQTLDKDGSSIQFRVSLGPFLGFDFNFGFGIGHF